GVHPIDRTGGDVYGGIESKGVIGSSEIVIDGFRHANNFYVPFMQLLGYGKGVVTADCNECLDVVLLERGDTGFQSVSPLGWIGAGGAKNGAAPRQNSTHGGQIKGHRFVLHQSPPAFEKSDELVLIVEMTLTYNRANHRV